MKRDMDLIRKIVLAIEDAPIGNWINHLEGVSQEEFEEHARLLIEAGFAEGTVSGFRANGSRVSLCRLTWVGHDFAAAVTNDTLWNQAKKRVIKPSASWSSEILLECVKALAKAQLGLP